MIEFVVGVLPPFDINPRGYKKVAHRVPVELEVWHASSEICVGYGLVLWLRSRFRRCPVRCRNDGTSTQTYRPTGDEGHSSGSLEGTGDGCTGEHWGWHDGGRTFAGGRPRDGGTLRTGHLAPHGLGPGERQS